MIIIVTATPIFVGSSEVAGKQKYEIPTFLSIGYKNYFRLDITTNSDTNVYISCTLNDNSNYESEIMKSQLKQIEPLLLISMFEAVTAVKQYVMEGNILSAEKCVQCGL